MERPIGDLRLRRIQWNIRDDLPLRRGSPWRRERIEQAASNGYRRFDLPGIVDIVGLAQRMEPRQGETRRVRPGADVPEQEIGKAVTSRNVVVEPGGASRKLIAVLIVVVEA